MKFIPMVAKLNFQQPLLQSSGSHDPSEIILIVCFGVQETFLIIINIENSCCLFFLEIVITFSALFDEHKVQKKKVNLK